MYIYTYISPSNPIFNHFRATKNKAPSFISEISIKVFPTTTATTKKHTELQAPVFKYLWCFLIVIAVIIP